MACLRWLAIRQKLAQPLHQSGGPLSLRQGVLVPKYPMVRGFPACCALAASGHAAAQPTIPINVRRGPPV
jgi:hypothetical protein